MDEREQQRVTTPRGPRRPPVAIERGGIEESATPLSRWGKLSRVDGGARRDHVDQPSNMGVPQDREVVNVHAMFKTIAAALTTDTGGVSESARY